MTTTLRVQPGQLGIAGDIVLPRVLVTALAACTLQTIIDGFALWRGEWFANRNAGFPWFQKVLGIRPLPTNAQVAQLIRQFLLGIPQIASVTTVTATFNGRTRGFDYAYVAILNTNEVVVGGSPSVQPVTGAP